MKKLLLFLFLICPVTVWAQKKEVSFHVKYLPNKAYTTTHTAMSKSVVNFEGPAELLDKIKAEVALPIVVESSNDMASTTTTGALRADKSFPATINYEKATVTQINNGNKTVTNSPLAGLIAKGSYSVDNKFKIDTLLGNNLTAELENTFRHMLENVQSQITFPAEPMKVGDSFEQKVPVSMPVAGGNPINMLIITHYKLKSIKGNIALFDIAQDVALNMLVEDQNIKASGSGTGVSEFDIKNSFITKYESDLDMSLTMDVNEMTITTKVNTKSKQHIKIN